MPFRPKPTPRRSFTHCPPLLLRRALDSLSSSLQSSTSCSHESRTSHRAVDSRRLHRSCKTLWSSPSPTIPYFLGSFDSQSRAIQAPRGVPLRTLSSKPLTTATFSLARSLSPQHSLATSTWSLSPPKQSYSKKCLLTFATSAGSALLFSPLSSSHTHPFLFTSALFSPTSSKAIQEFRRKNGY